MTGARQIAREKERNRDAAIRQIEAEQSAEGEGHGDNPLGGELRFGPGFSLPDDVEPDAPKLSVLWLRTPNGASVPTSKGGLPGKIDLARGDYKVTVIGQRVIIERELGGGNRLRVSLPHDLCVFEYE
jgi:hypothetical protein